MLPYCSDYSNARFTLSFGRIAYDLEQLLMTKQERRFSLPTEAMFCT